MLQIILHFQRKMKQISRRVSEHVFPCLNKKCANVVATLIFRPFLFSASDIGLISGQTACSGRAATCWRAWPARALRSLTLMRSPIDATATLRASMATADLYQLLLLRRLLLHLLLPRRRCRCRALRRRASIRPTRPSFARRPRSRPTLVICSTAAALATAAFTAQVCIPDVNSIISINQETNHLKPVFRVHNKQ